MAKKKVGAVSVVDGNGTHIRSYSEEDHGKGFKKLAKDFASKVEGRKVVSAGGEDVEDEDE